MPLIEPATLHSLVCADHDAPVVITTLRTKRMMQLQVVAVRALAERRSSCLVMGTALIATRF
jgi:hypothetical protein